MQKLIFPFSLSLLFLMQNLFPIILQPVKAVLIIFAIIGFIINIRDINFNLKPICISVFFSLVGLFWSMYGFYFHNPGALPLLSVMFIYPLLYIFPMMYNDSINATNINNLVGITAWTVTLSQLFFLLSFFGLDNGVIYRTFLTLYGDLAIIDSERGMLLFTLPSIGSLLFLFPYILISLFFSARVKVSNYILIAVMIAVIALSGRRAFYVAVVLSAIFVCWIAIYYSLIGSKTIKRLTLFLFFIIFIFLSVVLFKFDINYIIDGIYSIFDFEKNEDNIERMLQVSGLLNGFYSSPLFGAGAGAVSDYVRSESQPWAYELFYLSFIFQYGIIGSLIYLKLSFLYFKKILFTNS